MLGFSHLSTPTEGTGGFAGFAESVSSNPESSAESVGGFGAADRVEEAEDQLRLAGLVGGELGNGGLDQPQTTRFPLFTGRRSHSTPFLNAELSA